MVQVVYLPDQASPAYETARRLIYPCRGETYTPWKAIHTTHIISGGVTRIFQMQKMHLALGLQTKSINVLF